MDKLQMAINVFNKRAVQYQDKFMDVALYHDSFDLFCNSIPKQTAAVLEIACGPGNITRYLLQKRPGFQLLGIDLAPNMLELARSNNPQAEFMLMDGRDILRLNKLFDGIMCGFCLPYLSREEAVKMIGDAARLLLPGGIFYISTMEDDYARSGFQRSGAGDELYMYYHQADYLVNALNANGFKIMDIRRKQYPAADGSTTTDLIIIAGI
ncbi:class I SAM-dependent methyltransferase [Chitinophaga ginsengisegetis]|uniref:class I SAM-dependent methyltransferase n=1 Tax=Chitinophaga ginsengisegetis TaxID=393003 RepID=UPI000DB93933|nr:class I SAM-dependent methyltransferase [Chitinophaga ginsengisegetis]MDR6569092.1 ubiquinone/menaquinone biosynthesis C-methylase UbiE [Chitinophaga ginsengisegetis]MDR6648879.1 ubiquinone/menaquinone biosynthesis C-methylase UbiE [Chitinophaga ginsengisegetis]MDR6655173.1 ubiquinone/menaquinone biosynthesis C-methylase UbiE [Chitinophaga ginsengisegetis]